MKYRTGFILVLSLLCFSLRGYSQIVPPPVTADTIIATVDSSRSDNPRKSIAATTDPGPRRAAIRSAILPGWGQIYNKKYWKLPIVYGALGITGAIFVNNLNQYKNLRFAYQARYKAIPRTGYNPTTADSSDYFSLSVAYKTYSLESIRQNRDQFRQYIDYSVLFFLLFWGLNVVDASVDAHLQSFDVSPDLSLKFKPGHSEMANTTGLSIVLEIGKHPPKKLPSASSLIY